MLTLKLRTSPSLERRIWSIVKTFDLLTRSVPASGADCRVIREWLTGDLLYADCHSSGCGGAA